jgi:hypothetical protein
MIFIISGNYAQAKKWANAQLLTDDEWFATLDLDELKSRQNFHVIVLESAAELPSPLFERVFRMAQIRGRMGRNDNLGRGSTGSD